VSKEGTVKYKLRKKIERVARKVKEAEEAAEIEAKLRRKRNKGGK
jgi:hypothetical protein